MEDFTPGMIADPARLWRSRNVNNKNGRLFPS
jgi:hypothetical protein